MHRRETRMERKDKEESVVGKMKTGGSCVPFARSERARRCTRRIESLDEPLSLSLCLSLRLSFPSPLSSGCTGLLVRGSLTIALHRERERETARGCRRRNRRRIVDLNETPSLSGSSTGAQEDLGNRA